jgi:outer membrane lipoprotein-sorting protein
MRSTHANRATARHLAVAAAFAAAGALLASAPATADEAPDADRIVAQMKAALEPDKPSVRTMTMSVRQDGESQAFTVAQARSKVAGEPRSLTVLLAPDDARGLAYLVADKAPGSKENKEWLYVPVVRRVRELVPAENYTSFLDSDFTYADLGFLDLGSTNKLLGSDTVGGKKAYKVESIPGSTTKQWYYARIVTWVDAETLLPLRREYYAPSGLMFKVATFDSVSRVDGMPTPFRITMENIPNRTSSELTVTNVTYAAKIPDEIFTPAKLRTIADLALWNEQHPAAAAPGA